MEFGESSSSADNSRRIMIPPDDHGQKTSSAAVLEDYARGVNPQTPPPSTAKPSRLARLLYSIQTRRQQAPPHITSYAAATAITTTTWCCRACATTLIILILLIIGITTLASTIFRPQRPEIKLESITVRDIDTSVDLVSLPTPHLKLTVGANIVIYNPNTVGYFEYDATSANLVYRGIQVGQTPITGGHINAGERASLNLTMFLQGERFLADSSALVNDVSAGSLPVSTTAEVSGNLYFFLFEIKVFVRGYISCSFNVGIVDRSVSNSLCSYKVGL